MRIRLTKVLIVLPLLILCPDEASARVDSSITHLPARRIVTRELSEPATGIALELTEDVSVEMQLREAGIWSEWQPVTMDSDTKPGERHSSLLFAGDATAVRLRSNQETDVTLIAISTEHEDDVWELAAAGRSLTPAPVIIPRWQWADETLRQSKRGAATKERAFYSTPDLVRTCSRRAYLYPDEFREKERKFTEDLDGDGKEEYLIWPIGHDDKKEIVVVHHTAEGSPRSAERSDIDRMRTIYQYHTTGRGWGDIGYNYVIGPKGLIFEGRAGGENAVGAHAYCNNVGSVGISLMGNFQNGKPTDQQINALRWLLVYVTDKHKIDPEASVIFHGKKMPTIIGHRDVRQTACPGQFSHELLPQIRIATNDRSLYTPLFSSAAQPSHQNEASPTESLLPVSVSMGQLEGMNVKYMNVGLETWGKGTWLHAEGDGLYFPYIRPYSFVAGTMQEESVAPGEIATFTVSLQGGLMKKHGTVTFTPIVNNERRLIRNTATLAFNTTEASPKYTHVTSYFPQLHKTGEDVTGTLKVLNAGTVPWEQNTITEIAFELEGGSGEVTILDSPHDVQPGEQGTYRVRLQNIEEEGKYRRKLVPRFLEGSSLVGDSINISAYAEPIPDIAYSSMHGAATEETISFKQDRITRAGSAIIESVAGTDLTLKPREQVSVPIRIRTGKNGVRRYEDIATIVRSNPTIVLKDLDSGLRMRTTLRSPVSLQAYKTHDFDLTIIAPRNEGSYTFSIGTLNFQILVRASGRAMIRKSIPPERVTTRTRNLALIMQERRALRAERLVRRAPAPAPTQGDSDIRIRLSYNKDSAILTSPSSLRVEGGGSIIFEDGPTHLSREQDSCKVSTANGSFQAPVIRFTPQNAASFTTIMTEQKSTNRFRGTLECRVIDGSLTMINELDIEEYLAGLAEEPDSEPWEKQRAFAIAARSYALYYVLSDQRKFPGKPYDGSDSPREFQAYGGVHFEQQNPRWKEAVTDTTGRILTWQRTIVKAPYFSSDGGQTNSAYSVWGWTHTPYLESKPDPWCKGMSSAGHGVGMSGCGAEGQANEGKTAEEILQYYYPGTNIMSLKKALEWEKRFGER